MTFKIGTPVQLKGGSPIMTITSTVIDGQGKNHFVCTWFDAADKEQTSSYPPEALRAYTGEGNSTETADD